MPGHDQQDAGCDQFLLGQLAIFAFRADQRREQIVARILLALGDQIAQVGGHEPGRFVDTVYERLQRLGLLVDRRGDGGGRHPEKPVITLIDAEHSRNHEHRQREGEFADQIDAIALLAHVGDQVHRGRFDFGTHSLDLTRGEREIRN
ncbi:MAG: hypothetical protein R2845_04960 [Thermomicrobiales bacterium]